AGAAGRGAVPGGGGGGAKDEEVDRAGGAPLRGSPVGGGGADPLTATKHEIVRPPAAQEADPPVLLDLERRRQGAPERIAGVGGDAREGLALRVVGVDLGDAGVGEGLGEIRRALEGQDAAVVAHGGGSCWGAHPPPWS